ncbi:MAG: hypothetical protein ACM3O6_03860 [Acidobacteriota bacterium]
MKVTEKRVLALTALMRHYPTDDGEPIPSWVGDLAVGPTPEFHVYDRLMHDGYITWESGWRLTKAGWKALREAAPRRGRSTPNEPPGVKS